ncbi:hypothetical protein PAHAL_5G277700 [Panicum hallii]|uniref:Uncharacterized protein n=1 Tax=Panicum hallii TaxID=206008 RepID=A0A2T8ILH5_9POAL|nr:hypothetical protein PAHAL_5G277700 [Panicum hallii]
MCKSKQAPCFPLQSMATTRSSISLCSQFSFLFTEQSKSEQGKQPQALRHPSTCACSSSPMFSSRKHNNSTMTTTTPGPQMELAITGHPDTADRELDDNHADQELFRSCSAPTSTPSLVAIAYATGKTSCKPTAAAVRHRQSSTRTLRLCRGLGYAKDPRMRTRKP